MLHRKKLKPSGFRVLSHDEVELVSGGHYDEELTDEYVQLRMALQSLSHGDQNDMLDALYEAGAFPSPMGGDGEGRPDWCGSTGTEFIPETINGIDISSACKLHDTLYGPGSTMDRVVADGIFFAHIMALFTIEGRLNIEGATVALVYFAGVRVGGGSAYAGQGSGL